MIDKVQKIREEVKKLHGNPYYMMTGGAFIEGYRQAEKDLELTWEDIKIILNIENDILRECNSQKELVIETYPKGENYYGEILKRFKAQKGGEL